MDDPVLYRKSRFLRADDHSEIMEEFAAKFNWRVEGNDSVLDIGCAGGNNTCETILPKLPPTFSRLVAVDINDKMLEYAKKNFKVPKVSFEKLDIGADISEFMREHDPFDHVVSLFCFHLVPDQRLAMKNVYDLLDTNGDCCIHVLGYFTGFDVYKIMFPKWSEYLYDIDDYVSPYHQRINPVHMLSNHLKFVGFKEYNVEERRKTVAYHDVQTFIDAFVPVFPFFSRLPPERKTEFLDEYVKLSMEVKPEPGVIVENFRAGQNVNIYVSYINSFIYARK